MAMSDGQNQKKSPGQTVADAALAGYDKGAKKKADSKSSSKNDFSLIPSLKKGGMVKKTGLHLLHKGEEVIPANKVKSLKRKGSMRKRTSAKA